MNQEETISRYPDPLTMVQVYMVCETCFIIEQPYVDQELVEKLWVYSINVLHCVYVFCIPK